MNRHEYNGWTNYETWCVALWLDNEEGAQQYMRERATEIYGDAEATDYGATRKQVAVRVLADDMEETHTEAADAFQLVGVFSDLMSSALANVNWQEIAGQYIDDIADDVHKEEFP